MGQTAGRGPRSRESFPPVLANGCRIFKHRVLDTFASSFSLLYDRAQESDRTFRCELLRRAWIREQLLELDRLPFAVLSLCSQFAALLQGRLC